MSERYFVGIRSKTSRRCRVYLGDPELAHAHWLRLPDGVDWGYVGREPLALARAMVQAVTDRDVEPAVVAAFAARVVQAMPYQGGSLSEGEAQTAVAQLRRELGRGHEGAR